MGVRQIYRHCTPCNRVVRVDEPECAHFGRAQRNSESVTVVFRGPDGKVSIPWEPTAKCPEGFVREEVRGARAVRRLERELDAKDLATHRATEERKARFQEPINKVVRENLLHRMRNATHPFEKSLAQAALDRMERSYSTNYDAGNHRS